MPRRLIRPLVGRKLTKPKFLRFPSLKQLLWGAIKDRRASRFAQQGGIQRLARRIHRNPMKPITAASLPKAYQNLPPVVVQQLVNTTQFAMQIPVPGLGDSIITTGVSGFPPLYQFDTFDSYLSEQGGRVGIGVEIGIFNPETDQLSELWHTFIFDDIPDGATLEQAIDDFVQKVCDSPAFDYLKDAEGYCNYLYNLVVVDYVT